jgi:predicted regulator of Ras-like GTPase activity (Roadblock/LC7/MglB family)
MQATVAVFPDVDSKELINILKHLNHKVEGIEASAVISTDGLIKAELLGDDIDPDRFGAMCASLLSLAKQAAEDTARGELKLVLIEGKAGSMLVVQIGQKGVLALAAKPKARLGLIFIEARKVAKHLAEVL